MLKRVESDSSLPAEQAQNVETKARSAHSARIDRGLETWLCARSHFRGDVQHVPDRNRSVTFFHHKCTLLFLADVAPLAVEF